MYFLNVGVSLSPSVSCLPSFTLYGSNSRNPQAPLQLPRPFNTPSPHSPLPSAVPKTLAFYAVVLYDFVAERPDELDAKAGDAVSVVAQVNREWFVAKSIGRLGRPGLIPFSFVELRDPATGKRVPDVGALIDHGTFIRVEDWKKQTLSYKANSTALGVLEDPSYSSRQQLPDRPPSPPTLPDGLLLSARVVSFHYELEEYWFHVHALYQPFDPSDSSTLPPAKQLVLYRAYNDFFDFQIALLDTFPREGSRGENPRIIPFLPRPSDQVDDLFTATRQTELDDYLRLLYRLNRTTARYILEHHLTREFFALKPGDTEMDADPQYGRMAEVGWYYPRDDPEFVGKVPTRRPLAHKPDPHTAVVRRTLIFPSESRQSTVEPGTALRKTSSTRRRRSTSAASMHSNRSLHDRVPTPPPPKSFTGRRFSSEQSPSLPQIPNSLLSQTEAVVDVPQSAPAIPLGISDSAYDSL